MEPRMLSQPLLDSRGLMRRIIVRDDVDFQDMRLPAGLIRFRQLRYLLVDLLQEFHPLFRPVAFIGFRDYCPGRDVKRREQVNGAVPDIIMGPLLWHAGHHRQHWLRPVKRLHLGLLVHAQHNRVLGRIQVQPDHIVDLLHEQRIGGQLERIGQVRFKVESLPDPADSGPGQAGTFRHGCPRPVGRVIRRFLQCIDDDFFYLLVSDRRLTSRTRLINQSVQALVNKPLTPLPGRCLMAPEHCGGFFIVWPCAQVRMILARSARACDDFARRAHLWRVARSLPESVNSALGRPVLAMSVTLLT